MNRQEYFAALRAGLDGLPSEDIERAVDFYNEMVEDRMEDGMSEIEAVEALGSPDDAVRRVLEEIPIPKLVKSRVKKKRRLRVWEIILLIIGSPVWLPLLIVFSVVVLLIIFLVYFIIWLVVVLLYLVVLCVGLVSLACIAQGIILCAHRIAGTGFLCIGCGLVLAGVTLFMILGMIQITKGAAFLTKKFSHAVRFCIAGRKKKTEIG